MNKPSSRFRGHRVVPLLLRALLLVGIAEVTGVAGVTHAEVSVNGFGPSINTLVLGSIVDDPNPIGIWLKVRSSGTALNEEGDLRGDGAPSIGWQTNSWPVVVWAYNAGSDFDIAFSEWDGTDWTPIEFLTSSTEDERDPSVFVEQDGTIHVAWSTQSKRVYLMTRPSGSPVWDAPQLITTGSERGWEPTVARFDGQMFVAYATTAAQVGMAQDIRVASGPPAGPFAVATVASTNLTTPPAAELHTDQARLWLDWQHADDELGCAEYLPPFGWLAESPEPLVESGWVGIEETRRVIRAKLLVMP